MEKWNGGMVEKWNGGKVEWFVKEGSRAAETRRAHTLARPAGSPSANVPSESLRDSSVHFLSPSGWDGFVSAGRDDRLSYPVFPLLHFSGARQNHCADTMKYDIILASDENNKKSPANRAAVSKRLRHIALL